MILRDEVLPRMILVFSIEVPRAFAIIFSTALLAFPFSAGALTHTLSASPNQPVIQSHDEPGTTFMLNFNCHSNVLVKLPPHNVNR